MNKKYQGYIYVHKSLLDSSIWNARGTFDIRSAWIDLLLRVNYEETEAMSRSGKTVIVGRGQLLTSQAKLAERWNWSTSKVHRFLERLKEAKMINFERLQWDKGATLVSVLNYCHYQDSSHFVKSKRNSNGIQTKSVEKASDAHLNKVNKVNEINKEGGEDDWE